MKKNIKNHSVVLSTDIEEYKTIEISEGYIQLAQMAREKRNNKKFPTSVALEQNDILELKKIAVFQGIPYQVLMRSFIKDGIHRYKNKISE